MVRPLLLFVSLLVLSCASDAAPVLANESLELPGLCQKIENLMNDLVDSTKTKCFPSARHGAVSFILIAEKPIFSVKASKKPWLIFTVGVVGQTMNAHPNIRSSQVFVSDLNIMRNRKSYKYPITLAKTLQRQAKAGQMGTEELYKQPTALVPSSLPSTSRALQNRK
jgi:hypothetical protein